MVRTHVRTITVTVLSAFKEYTKRVIPSIFVLLTFTTLTAMDSHDTNHIFTRTVSVRITLLRATFSWWTQCTKGCTRHRQQADKDHDQQLFQ